jgi:beta-lactamase superfamily II metal-dependent hydrolase
MPSNRELRVHFVNVNHGDATILEFPDDDLSPTARFGVIDFGAKKAEDRGLTRDYLNALIQVRVDGVQITDYVIEFACCTHPHNDHYGGLTRFMRVFSDAVNPQNNKVRAFWDCGFRTNSPEYNQILVDILANQNIQFLRLGSGSEFKFGDVRIAVLAPSVDLRNRFDTYGIGKNDASIVLKVQFGNSFVILTGDAEFASWGKSTEEFPRREEIEFYNDALGLAERDETADQLKCDLLKLSHHGSMHGTSLEYLERIKPNRLVIPAGDDNWYQTRLSNWVGMFPHPLIDNTLDVLEQSINQSIDRKITGDVGNIIYTYSGGWTPHSETEFPDRADSPNFQQVLDLEWNNL